MEKLKTSWDFHENSNSLWNFPSKFTWKTPSHGKFTEYDYSAFSSAHSVCQESPIAQDAYRTMRKFASENFHLIQPEKINSQKWIVYIIMQIFDRQTSEIFSPFCDNLFSRLQTTEHKKNQRKIHLSTPNTIFDGRIFLLCFPWRQTNTSGIFLSFSGEKNKWRSFFLYFQQFNLLSLWMKCCFLLSRRVVCFEYLSISPRT